MARRKTKKTEEVDTTKDVSEEIKEQEKSTYEEVLEVTDEFVLQDVEDTDISEVETLEDLDKTEVEAAIEEGSDIELIEEEKPKAKAKRKPKAERKSAIDEKRLREKQLLPKVQPAISKEKKNNGIRTTAGLFFR